jgi:hypothetical protein
MPVLRPYLCLIPFGWLQVSHITAQSNKAPSECVQMELESVDRDLRLTKKAHRTWGKWVAYYVGSRRIYPIRMPWSMTPAAPAFREGSDVLLTGTWSRYRRGVLRSEDVFEQGYLKSSKVYDRKGRLIEWFDFGASVSDQPYSSFVQVCEWSSDKETMYESISFIADGRWETFGLEHFRTYMRRKAANEIDQHQQH